MRIVINDETPYDIVTGKKTTGNVYTIGLPVAVCAPLNADFDGDQIAVHLVPEEVKEDTYAKMSPRYVNIYKKNNEPIYVPTLEALNGLCVLSEVRTGDPKEIKDPKFYYTNWSDLVKDVEINRTVEFDRPIRFTGKIGTEEYNNKITTYGRLKISKVIDRDIDRIGIFKKEYPDCLLERITSKPGAKLYQFTYPMPDGPEKIAALQKLAYRAVTEAGVVTFDFKTLFAETDSESYRKLRAIADDPNMSDKQKTLLLFTGYKKYCKEVEGTFSDDLKYELDRAAKIKLSSIMDINIPQFIISGVDEIPKLNTKSLMTGLDESEYIYHAIENRSLQSIKQSGTPSSGLVI
jgi:hypothetical protein